MPRVSIGLPVYNGENYLKESLDAILSQTFDDFELIISDNASKDKTKDICKTYAEKDHRIRYYRNKQNLGAIKNYNLVFELSTGEYFKWAAHDDLIAPNYLEKCVEVLNSFPNVVLCFSNIIYVDADGKALYSGEDKLGILEDGLADRLHFFYNHQKNRLDIFWSIFGLIRSSALRSTGLLDRFVASDQALLIKLLLQGQFYQVPDKIFYRRVHPQASTIALPKSKTYRERAEWYDATNPTPLVLPNWRLMKEDIVSVKRYKLNLAEKARCFYWIAKKGASRWKRLVYELVSIPRQVMENR